MPQLDINTFLYQYIGITSLLLLTYVMLSYLVLPLVLREICVRSRFLETTQMHLDSAVLTNTETRATLALSEGNILGIASLRNQSFIGTSYLLTLVINSVKNIRKPLLFTQIILNIQTFSSPGFSGRYLTFFLLIDEFSNNQDVA